MMDKKQAVEVLQGLLAQGEAEFNYERQVAEHPVVLLARYYYCKKLGPGGFSCEARHRRAH